MVREIYIYDGADGNVILSSYNPLPWGYHIIYKIIIMYIYNGGCNDFCDFILRNRDLSSCKLTV